MTQNDTSQGNKAKQRSHMETEVTAKYYQLKIVLQSYVLFFKNLRESIVQLVQVINSWFRK